MPEQGIAVYDIKANGCLNGVYTNELAGPAGTIFNEIARKQNDDTTDPVAGTYDCAYFDPGNALRNGVLRITRRPGTNMFDFFWTLNQQQTPAFQGAGYLTNPQQITVSYWSV